MNIYLDIDGVLITKEGNSAQGVAEFLKFITASHNVYWLTTHCRGDAQTATWWLEDKLPVDARPLLDKIKPTNWQSLKTEAIDFNQDFRWLDDYVMQAELDVLKSNRVEEKLLLIDLKAEPGILNKLMNTSWKNI